MMRRGKMLPAAEMLGFQESQRQGIGSWCKTGGHCVQLIDEVGSAGETPVSGEDFLLEEAN